MNCGMAAVPRTDSPSQAVDIIEEIKYRLFSHGIRLLEEPLSERIERCRTDEVVKKRLKIW
jgi:hypothetical protein